MKDHKQVRIDLNDSLSVNYDRYRLVQEDYEFATVTGAMWKGDYAENFKNKPKPEINKIFASINRILGQKQRMEMNAKIISNSDDATEEGASLLQSRWRNDFQSSDGIEAVNNSDQEAFFGGFGAFKLVAKYEDEENPQAEKQYLCIEPVYSAASSVVFSPSVRKDKSDSKQCWHIIRTSLKEAQEEYGNDVSSVNGQMDWFDWATDSEKDVYLAHYYEVIEKRITEYDFGGGYKITTGDGIKDSYGNKIARADLDDLKENREHDITRRKVKYVEYALMSGDKFLTKPQLMPFKRVPVIPQYGYYQVINGIEYFCGEVRKRRDPQMFLNTYHSSLMEIMSAPQVQKPEYTPEQIAAHAAQRSQADIDNAAFIMSDPILNPDGSINHVGPIGMQNPPEVGSGLMAAGQQLNSDLIDMAGTGQSTLPSNAAADAVRQVNERQDDAFQPLMQNSMEAVRAACEVWINAAQKLYFSNQRSLRVMSADGSFSQVKTMEYDIDDNGVFAPTKNSANGRYAAQVKVGESYKSKKEVELETTLKMLQFADTNTPQGQLLMNQAIISTTGEGGARSREVAKYQMIDNMIMLGLDPKPESDEEKEYVERKIQQIEQASQQPPKEDPVVMLERMKEQTLQMVQQNKATEHQIQIARLQTEAEGKGAKLQSDILTNARKLEQNQQKLDNDKLDNDYKNALSTLDLELQAKRDLNAELNNNLEQANNE